MATSSARYVDLYEYARAAERLDYDLMEQADRLINRLSYCEATCREPGIRVGSDSLGSAMRSYAVHALPVDQRVRTVGEAFQRADGQAGTLLGRLAKSVFGAALFRRLRPGRVLADIDSPGRRYTIQPGDTLGEIAKRFGVTVPDLVRGNGIGDPDLIHPGLSLVIPGTRPPAPTPKPMPVPTPGPLPAFFDGEREKPGWVVERVGKIKNWFNNWFTRPAPEKRPVEKSSKPDAVKATPIITNSVPVSPKRPAYGKLLEGNIPIMTQGAHRNDGGQGDGIAVDIGIVGKAPTVHSLVGGKVIKKGYDKDGYGNYVKVLQDDGKVVLYAHLEKESDLETGDKIDAGEKLGLMGNTGRSTGIHLHIEIRRAIYDEQGNYDRDDPTFPAEWEAGKFDPVEYLKERGVAL